MTTVGNHYKVVLLGSTGVGKTSLFLRFRDGCFYPDTTVTLDTADITVKKLKVDEKDVKIWDTAGMERYRSPTDSYFRNCKAALFVYSVTDKASFHDLASTWTSHLSRFEDLQTKRVGAGYIPCRRFLLANKIDLEEEYIEEDLTESLCERICIERSFEMSAKTGEGVDEAFQEIARILNVPDSAVNKETVNLGSTNKTESSCSC